MIKNHKGYIAVLFMFLATFFGISDVLASPIDPPPTDKSIEYMRYIFGDAVELIFRGNGPDEPDSILGAMSVILNLGCLLFSGIIIGYTALAGVLNTAHEGEVMGKAYNTMWVPLRTVFAIALLMPLSSGFSAMQMGVLWFAGKGVGLADSAWNAAIDHMDTTGMLYPPNLQPRGEQLAKEFLFRAACMEIINRTKGESVVTRKPDTGQSRSTYYIIQQYTGSGNSLTGLTTTNEFVAGIHPFFSLAMPVNVCGTVKLEFYRPDDEQISYDASVTYQQRHKAAFEQMENAMYSLARNLINNDGFNPTGDELRIAADLYDQAITQAVQDATQQVSDDRNAQTNWVNIAKQDGWVTAGSWYMSIMRLNQATFDMLNTTPVFTNPDAEEIAALEDYGRLMSERIDVYLKNRIVETKYGELTTAAAAEAIGTDGEESDGLGFLGKGLSFGINSILEYEDPLMGMQNLGHNIIWVSIGAAAVASASKATLSAADKWAGGGLTGALADLSTGGGAKAATAFALSLSNDVLVWITMLAISLLSIGFMLAIYLPTMPYVIWMLAIAGWFVLLIEALVAAPVWAAAHSIPEGDGAISNHAKAGYMILLSLFLRPTLMLFGLFGSMILMVIMGRVVALTFVPMMASTNAGHSMGLAVVIGFLIIFTGLMISIAHRAYGLIHEIPDKVLRYIGAMSETLGEAGHEQTNRSTFVAGAASITKQITPGEQNQGVQASNAQPKPPSNNNSEEAKLSPT